MRLAILLSCLFADPAPTQAGADHVVVITRTTSPAASALFDADLATGAIQPLARFSLDRFPPLAVAVDGVNRDVVVALQTPIGTSVLVRLRVRGTAIIQEQSLGDVPGIVQALAQALDGDWVSTTTTGIYATARNGSVPRTIAFHTNATAIETFGMASAQAVIAQSGTTTSDPQVRWIDLTSGRTIAGPWVYVGHTPPGITGVADLPTGASRQVLSQTDGTIAMSVNFANPTTLPLTPALPPGATTAMHVRGIEGTVLGDSAHPFLKSFQALGGTQWTILAGPIPGDPVDFAFRPEPVAATVPFARACASMQLGERSGGGPPRLGSTTFGLELTHGLSSAPAFLLLGASDVRFGALRLPATLPGGCQALASAEVVLATMTSGFGDAALTIGVPNQSSLLGGIAYCQWMQVRGAALDTSNAGALWFAN